MALSRRDVIIAAVVAFISWGYLTHWKPDLRYIPHAFFTGVVLTLAALGWITISTTRHTFNPQDLPVYPPRHVAFVAKSRWESEKAALRGRAEYDPEPPYPSSLVLSDSLDSLINLILRDFVKSWYRAISRRPTFPNEVEKAIRAALANIRDRVLAVDLVEIIVSRLVPIITSHLKDFYEAEKVVRGRKLSRTLTESEELDLAIARKYKDGKLHPAASLSYSNTKHVQQQYLRGVVTRLLPRVLPGNMTTSPAVTVLIKEIVACAVLFPVMKILGDPDTWNQLIVVHGQSVLQDRKTVRKLRAALDEHAPASPKRPKTAYLPKLQPNDSERKFEKFVRVIRQCNTLSDARRFRSEVASQLRKDSAVEGQDPLYLRRLETAKRILDQKVTTLGTGTTDGKPSLSLPLPEKQWRGASRLENASLKDVLQDASGLSYFMEYMDRLGLMRLVQFWIVVDGFRNPLEDDLEELDTRSGFLPTWTDSERIDLAQINEGYLSKPELKITSDARKSVADFLRAGKTAKPEQYHSARLAVIRSQTAVYHEMQETHFPKFKKSDLWFKYLASDEASLSAVSPADSMIATGRRVSTPAVPAKLVRTNSQKAVHQQAPDLRRAIASASDLRGTFKPNDRDTPTRRSLDGANRAPLFDDDNDSDPLSRSIQSLDSDNDPSRVDNNANIVDAMQAALTDIMGEDADAETLLSPPDTDSLRGSLEIPRPTSPFSKKERERPSLASLGLVGDPARRGVFRGDDLFESEERILEDELDDSDKDEKVKDNEDEIHEAAPGDLGLAEAIDALTVEIERLVTQESIVDSLTNKAELTNNAAELRILRKSKTSLQREIHRKELQRQQYLVQESDSSLYGRATVSIQSIVVGTDEDGTEYAMYVIEVKRQAGEQMPAATWVIARRYSEFHQLNKRLRAKYPQIRNLEFPRRQMVLKLQKDFLQKRKQGLERYLQELLLIPSICRSRELRAFLSQRAISDGTNHQDDARDFVSRIYSSVTDGMEEFLGNIPVLDQLSLAGQNLISAATSQLNATGNSPTITSPTPSSAISATGAPLMFQPTNDLEALEAESEYRAYDTKDSTSLVKPIADLFFELFELNRESNWLRGRTIVIILHQILGGTIQRKIRELAKALTQENSVLRYIDILKDSMWPNGSKKVPGKERDAKEKERTKQDAAMVLASLIPELVGSVVGRTNAGSAGRRVTAVVNNARLNTHLTFTLLDEIVQILFEDGPIAW